MVQIDMKYLGDKQFEATHGPSGVKLQTDPPVDNQGKGRSFSPTDLLATALGSCMATIMAIVGERHQLDLSGMTVTVQKEMTSQPVRRVGTLRVAIKVPKPVAASDQKLLEEAAKTCPVCRSLHPDLIREINFSWEK